MTETTVVQLELRRTAQPRTLEGLCVPYGAISRKAGYPQGERFLAFARTAFDSKIDLSPFRS